MYYSILFLVVAIFLSMFKPRCAFSTSDLRKAINSKKISTFNISSIYFSHIMKCGGSTIDNLLRRYGGNHNIPIDGTEATTASRAVIFKDRRRWSIVIIREPLQRVFSHYLQVKPWGNHTAGSASQQCRKAANESYSSFISNCTFAKNYMSRYLQGKISVSLTDYTLVVPYEYYDQGMMILRMFANFTVEDILYLVKKNYSYNPAARAVGLPTPAEIAMTRTLNLLDTRLHQKAIRIWNQTTASLDNFDSQINSYRAILNELNNQWRHYDAKIHPTLKDEQIFISNYCQSNRKCRHNDLSK